MEHDKSKSTFILCGLLVKLQINQTGGGQGRRETILFFEDHWRGDVIAVLLAL